MHMHKRMYVDMCGGECVYGVCVGVDLCESVYMSVYAYVCVYVCECICVCTQNECEWK